MTDYKHVTKEELDRVEIEHKGEKVPAFSYQGKVGGWCSKTGFKPLEDFYFIYFKKTRRVKTPCYRLSTYSKEGSAISARLWRTASPARAFLAATKQRAKDGGLDFNLELEDIKIPTYCPVLGLKLTPKGGRRTMNTPSIDRIDNNKGYVKGNIAIISWRANWRKGDLTLEEVEKIYFYMKGHKEKNDNQ